MPAKLGAARTCVDLFAGAGGLSLGLRAAGFTPVTAVEMSPMAGETYFRNLVARDAARWERHLASPVNEQVRNGLAVATTKTVLEQIRTLTPLMGERGLDLLAGGPPCQGFSLAGLRRPEDQRNQLPFEFLRFVELLSPRLVLIENVAGIASFRLPTGGNALQDLRDALVQLGPTGYVAQILQVNAKDFGVPQSRPRVMIVAIRKDLARALAPGETDADLQLALATPSWSSTSADRPLLAPIMPRGTPVTVREALADLGENGDYRLQLADYGEDLAFARAMREGPLARLPVEPTATSRPLNHQPRSHGDRVAARFRLHIALRPYGMPRNVFGIGYEHASSLADALQEVFETLETRGVPEPLLMPDGSRILDDHGRDAGVNHLALASTILRLASGKHSQKALDPDRPSTTVMSLPDDFVHYAWPRTLTVREMARLQSFPDTFEFYSKETTGAQRRKHEVPQYTQVGNAVPPLLAEAIGRHLLGVLKRAESAAYKQRGG